MEILDQTGWLWGLSLIVLTMAIHATAVVMLAFAGGTHVERRPRRKLRRAASDDKAIVRKC